MDTQAMETGLRFLSDKGEAIGNPIGLKSADHGSRKVDATLSLAPRQDSSAESADFKVLKGTGNPASVEVIGFTPNDDGKGITVHKVHGTLKYAANVKYEVNERDADNKPTGRKVGKVKSGFFGDITDAEHVTSFDIRYERKSRKVGRRTVGFVRPVKRERGESSAAPIQVTENGVDW